MGFDSLFSFRSHAFSLGIGEPNMPDIGFVRSEIERKRTQVARQRKEILLLQRAGIATASAEALLERMLAKIDDLCVQRDELRKDQQGMNCQLSHERSVRRDR
jgi:hypothetical protein